MDKAVISERLLELIADREVLAALFTTYTFEPEFFELEVIPLLLDPRSPYSTDERVKRIMVRENLRETGLPIDIFYDLNMFRRSGDTSPEMEYLCHGVNMGNGEFHGKVTMILLKDRDTGLMSMLVAAGSNNLTRAGWWDNIECQHWEEVKSGEVSRKFINVLGEDVDFLLARRTQNLTDQDSAIHRIQSFLASCKGSNSADSVFYFGLSFPENRRNFTSFLANDPSPLTQYSNWHLEIISPFFADDVENREHEIFWKMGVEDIRLLLPTDEQGSALCQEAYFNHIQAEEGIAWARWRSEVNRALGLNGGYYRRLHAKVYHFYNGRQSWVFVGSVNFTYKAIHMNVEAGFFVRLPKPGPLLEELPPNAQIEKFVPPEQLESAAVTTEEESGLPDVHLCYDWVNKRLLGHTSEKRMCYAIEIIGPEGQAVIDPWEIRYEESGYEGKTDRLEIVLRNGSLVKVRGVKCTSKVRHPFPEHRVLMQQVGWSHKPLDLPTLSATQILAIYTGMSPERRQLMMMDAKVRALVLSAQGGELTSHVEDQVIDQFFCEYAEIFNAFGQLKATLAHALEEEHYPQVDYYLTGTGVDSIPTLIDRAISCDGQSLKAVTTYLILLSALEFYKDKQYQNRPNVGSQKKKLRAAIKQLKSGDGLLLEDNSPTNRKVFFSWFETEFFREYTMVEGDQA